MRRGGLISRDLLFASRIRGAAAAQGWEVTQVSDPSSLSQQETSDWEVVLIDLAAAPTEIGELVERLRRAVPQCRMIAFDAHVAEDRLEAARRMGCDLVLPRRDLNKRLPRLFLELARTDPSHEVSDGS